LVRAVGFSKLTAMVAAAATIVCAPAAQAATYTTGGFEEQTIVSGLSRPTTMAWAPDGRMFVVEKNGMLKVVAPGAQTATVVADYSSEVNHYSDRGLLGLAVDSGFAQNGYLYLLYTYDLNPMMADSGSPMVSQLARVRVNSANQVTERTVILGTDTSGPCPTPAPATTDAPDCIPADGTSHSIGTVRSAPDGTLWVGNGDASEYGGVDSRALRTYNENSMAGKLMHITRDGQGLPAHSFCPGNADLADVCTKLHAKGFRNPFRFTLRPGGGIALGDVGWNSYEEINLIGAGGVSYGWPCFEGSTRTPSYQELSECQAQYATVHQGPDHEYPHGGGLAVMAGPTYTGTAYPAGYRNSIFFGDYAGGFIRRLVPNGGGGYSSVDFAGDWAGTAIEADPDGNLAYASVGNFDDGEGSVRRIVYSPGNRGPIAQLNANPTSGTAPLSVSFNPNGSSDPDGDQLSYNWDFGDGTPNSAARAPSHTYSASGIYTARLTVSDGRGRSATATETINAGNTAPVISVTGDTRYRGGEIFRLRATASDAQDGTLPDTAFDWNVRLIHAEHTHVGGAGSYSNRAQIDIQANTDHDSDSHYEVEVTATDAGGVSTDEVVRVDPETATLRLRSSPPGVPVSYGGLQLSTPRDLTTAVGFRTTLSVPQSFEQGGQIFDFGSWSDGGARVHDFAVPPGGGTVTATFGTLAAQVPGSATPEAGNGSGADKAGPALRLTGVNARRGRLRGSALDASGLRLVQVAVRGPRTKAGCRWWVPRLERMSVGRRSCRRPRWLAAELTAKGGGVRWLAKLGSALPVGSYRIVVRAFDVRGNGSQLGSDKRTLVRVKR